MKVEEYLTRGCMESWFDYHISKKLNEGLLI